MDKKIAKYHITTQHKPPNLPLHLLSTLKPCHVYYRVRTSFGHFWMRVNSLTPPPTDRPTDRRCYEGRKALYRQWCTKRVDGHQRRRREMAVILMGPLPRPSGRDRRDPAIYLFLKKVPPM